MTDKPFVTDLSVQTNIKINKRHLAEKLQAAVPGFFAKDPYIRFNEIEPGVLGYEIDYDDLAIAVENGAVQTIVDNLSMLRPDLRALENVSTSGSGKNARVHLTLNIERSANAAAEGGMVELKNMPPAPTELPKDPMAVMMELQKTILKVASYDRTKKPPLTVDAKELMNALHLINQFQIDSNKETHGQIKELLSYPQAIEGFLKAIDPGASIRKEGLNKVHVTVTMDGLVAMLEKGLNQYAPQGIASIKRGEDGKAVGTLDFNQAVDMAFNRMQPLVYAIPGGGSSINIQGDDVRITLAHHGLAEMLDAAIQKPLDDLANKKPDTSVSLDALLHKGKSGKGQGGGIDPT